MSNLRLFEPRFLESRLFEPRLFDPLMTDTFDTMLRRFMAPLRFDVSAPLDDMRVDVTEAADCYKVSADLPGVNKDDINVSIDGNMVTIEAEIKRNKESTDKAGKVLRSERYSGLMSRAFTLTQDIDEARASAKYEDGVLTLELPKKESVPSKRLAIQ
jgi:HSP20 family protein